MEFITGRHMERRTFLRGLGATVALPFLDAMVPSGRGWSRIAAASERPRLVCIEMVHGAAGCNALGATKNLWSPAAVGRDFDLSPSALAPLEPFRKHLTIISNTDVRMAEAFASHEIGGDHFLRFKTAFVRAHPRRDENGLGLRLVNADMSKHADHSLHGENARAQSELLA